MCKSSRESLHSVYYPNDYCKPQPPTMILARTNQSPCITCLIWHSKYDNLNWNLISHLPLQQDQCTFLHSENVLYLACFVGQRQALLDTIILYYNRYFTSLMGWFIVGKGASTIHYICYECFGAMHLHVDNCRGQNKNRSMMYYLIWRVIVVCMHA